MRCKHSCLVLLCTLIALVSLPHLELWVLVPTGVEIPKVYASGTSVGGIIWSNTTWTLENSPYIVTENILVDVEATLTIEPGVTVKFDGKYYLLVKGTLSAIGTADNYITFTSNKPVQTSGDWGLIDFYYANDASILRYCIIEYAGGASVGADMTRAGIEVRHSSPTIVNNVIRKNGVHGIALIDNGSPNISHNLIILTDALGYHPETQGAGAAIYASGNNPTPIIMYNTLTLNNYGIFLFLHPYPTISKNNIYGNYIYDIKLYNDVPNVDASNNWWGTTNITLIDEHIYDFYDDFTLGKVNYIPILSVPHPDTPKIPTTISCSASPAQLTIGKAITVSGAISPKRSGVTVALSYTMPNATVIKRTVTSTPEGKYSDTYTPPSLGSWSVKASWEGDSTYGGATSPSVSFNVSKISTTISCSVSSTSISIGSSLTVSGSITPARPSVTVTISYRSDGSWSSLTTVASSSDGSYSYTWTPTFVGSYQLKASWEGDSSHIGAASTAESVTVAKISTTISCSVSPSEVTEGDSITVSGSISPTVSGKTITLTYKKPDGSTFDRTVTTGSDGSYSDSYKSEAIGSWSVSASWAGDSTHEGASSSKPFTVKKKGICIIATATYGSELSPEVQFLRDFRDNTVLTTFAGNNFMAVFNGFYYSFSPTVASTISGNEFLRGMMKVILYPLIGILHISSVAFSLLSFSPELGVVMAGFVASSLIGAIYITPWILLLSFLRKFKPPVKIIRLICLVWSGSVLAISLAEATMSSLLMTASTGAFVLTTICLTTLTVVRAVTKRHIL